MAGLAEVKLWDCLSVLNTGKSSGTQTAGYTNISWVFLNSWACVANEVPLPKHTRTIHWLRAPGQFVATLLVAAVWRASLRNFVFRVLILQRAGIREESFAISVVKKLKEYVSNQVYRTVNHEVRQQPSRRSVNNNIIANENLEENYI